MSLPFLVSGVDLATALQDDIDLAAAELALRRASGRVRRYTRQTISLVTDDVIVRIPQCADELVLPQRPVVSVASVVVNGQTSTDWKLRGDTLVRCGGWPYGATITYTHGYAEIPDDIQDIVLAQAGFRMINPGMLRSRSIDDYSETLASESIGSGSLSRDDKDILDTYRRRTFSVAPS